MIYIYNIGLFLVGATIQEPTDIRFIYENAEGFAVFPTFYVTYGVQGFLKVSFSQDFPINLSDPTRV